MPPVVLEQEWENLALWAGFESPPTMNNLKEYLRNDDNGSNTFQKAPSDFGYSEVACSEPNICVPDNSMSSPSEGIEMTANSDQQLTEVNVEETML
jgi:hypothetical protein